MEGHERQRHQHHAEDKDQPRAAGFALGQRAVHRKGPAVVLRQPAAEEIGQQRREHKRQQKRQRIHTALAQYRQEN